MRRRSTPHAWALRCRIIPACATGASNKDVATQLDSTPHAVGRWRKRFVEHRIASLGDMPRPGGPRTVTDEQVAAVVTKTLESTPKNTTHWSTRAMARGMGLSQSTVSRIWRAFGLQPHRTETSLLSADPYFIDKVHDVVGLYLDPPERALVFCVDEKSQIQALDRSQPVPPMMPGVPQRVTHDDARAGTTTLFAALEVATGKVIGSLHRRHRTEEFKKFLIKLDQEVPAGLDVHLVLDNYATHKTPAIKTWLNLVERWSAELTNKRIRRGVHRSVQALEKDIRAWIVAGNTDPRPYVWTKSADEILERLASYLNRIPDSEDQWRCQSTDHAGFQPGSMAASRAARSAARLGSLPDPPGRRQLVGHCPAGRLSATADQGVHSGLCTAWQARALRFRVDAALARCPGVLPKPPAWPDQASSGGTRRCDGWSRVLDCGHDRGSDPDAPRRLRVAAGR